MIRFRKRGLALIGTAALTAAIVGVPAASATATTRSLAAVGTPFGQAAFASYGTGSELELSALRGVTNKLADVDQAFSGVTASSSGLGPAVTSPITGSVVQPAVTGTVNATARGSGLEVGVGVVTPQPDATQLGLAQAKAPPSSTVGTLAGPAVSAIPLTLPGIITTGVLHGFAATSYSPDFCPVGQPLALGLGGAAAPTSVLGGLVGAPGAATSATRADLVANADGTFGLKTTVQESIAPLVVTLIPATALTAATTLTITIQGTSPSTPVSLTAYTDGEGHSSVTLGAADPTVTVLLTSPVPGLVVGPITASLKGIAALINPLLDTGGTISGLLGTLGVDLTLHIGNGTTVVSPLRTFTNSANTISGSYDLLSLDLGLGPVATETHIVSLNLGHMEAAATLPNGPIQCTVPIAKNANPAVVQAGSSFVWSISVPATSTSLSDSSCDLTHIKLTDKISVNSGSPTFTIGAISNGGVYDASTQTITWANLGNYHPGDPPIVLSVNVSTPSNSAAGVLQDTANATAGLGNCTGGINGVATLIGPNLNAIISGSITLVAPQITAGAGLPVTGSGPVLPWLATGLLVTAAGAVLVLRRAGNNT